jgi:hypothetical protein
MPWLYALDANGAPCGYALAYFYAAGTTTPVDTYSDVGLTTANTNPVVGDVAGVIGPVYLSPGSSYKLVLKTNAGVTIRTQDNIAATPASNVDVDVAGLMGDSFTAGQMAYLSDGVEGRTPGRWYLTDADFSYNGVDQPIIGFVLASVASGDTGSFRIAGRMTNLSGLTVGQTYYLSGNGGAITLTPGTYKRAIGTADSASTLVMAGSPQRFQADVNVGRCDGRLTLTTATPITTTNVSAATTVYFTPHIGNRIALYNTSSLIWTIRAFAELSLSITTASSSKPYDIFAYDNLGVVTLEMLGWTDATNRATALVRQDGVLVKSGDASRRYVGTFFASGSGGQTDDSENARYLFNQYNRAYRSLRLVDTTNTWTYSTATTRQANGAASNKVSIMAGTAEILVDLTARAMVTSTGSGTEVSTGIGVDSTTAQASGSVGASKLTAGAAQVEIVKQLKYFPAPGKHDFNWLEQGGGSDTQTWYGDNGSTLMGMGLTGLVEM